MGGEPLDNLQKEGVVCLQKDESLGTGHCTPEIPISSKILAKMGRFMLSSAQQQNEKQNNIEPWFDSKQIS